MAKIRKKTSNDLIAEFMGYTIGKMTEWMPNNPRWYAYIVDEERAKKDGRLWALYDSIHVNELKYDRDWNALMEVVEKIESLHDEHHGYFQVHISSNSCNIQGTNLHKAIENLSAYGWVYMSDPNAILDSKLKSTYYNVVAFIKWYNDEKESNR